MACAGAGGRNAARWPRHSHTGNDSAEQCHGRKIKGARRVLKKGLQAGESSRSVSASAASFTRWGGTAL